MPHTTIVLYTRRNVGLWALPYLVARGFKVKVITDDLNIIWMSETLQCEVVDIDTMGDFDLFICVHGNKIIDKKYLIPGKFINIHPCLFKYKGHNPIKRYIQNKDTVATVESQYMIEEVDGGPVIHTEHFETPVCNVYAEFYNIATPYYFKCLEATLNKVMK